MSLRNQQPLFAKELVSTPLNVDEYHIMGVC